MRLGGGASIGTRLSAGGCCRCTRVRVIAASRTSQPINASQSLRRNSPPLTYSISRNDVHGAELGMLLAASCTQEMFAGPPMCRQNYSYWCTEAGLHHASRLELAVRRSVATVACFTSGVDVYGAEGEGAQQHDASHLEELTPRGVPDMDWNWLRPQQQQAPRPRKSLVGFARASGDNSLVATIYDVAVHPSMRGHGIARRMVKLLVQQIQSRAVYDIGVVTPLGSSGATRFWERCCFEDDREDSTFMMFMGVDGRGDAPRSPQELLEDSSLVYWEAAQQSPSLQAVLRRKLAGLSAGAEQGGDGAWEKGGRTARRGRGSSSGSTAAAQAAWQGGEQQRGGSRWRQLQGEADEVEGRGQRQAGSGGRSGRWQLGPQRVADSDDEAWSGVDR